MRYFKRQLHHFIKIDDDNKKVYELFGTTELQRIQVTTNEASYNVYVSQINANIYQPSTEAEYYDVLSKLSPFLNEL